MDMQKTTSVPNNSTRHAMLGGALIDPRGREIPITESMIQRACRDLEHHCQPLRKHS